MSRPFDIARKTDFGKPEKIEQAMAEMADVSDAELYETIITTQIPQSGDWKKAGSLARAEVEIRRDKAAQKLATKTTAISAGVGIIGVVLGAFLGAWLATPNSGSSVDKPPIQQSN